MTDFLFESWQGVQRTYEEALRWLASLQYDPRQWDAVTWLVVAAVVLVIAAMLLASGRRRRAATGPQFLLTNGQIVLVGEAPRAAPADGGRRTAALLQAPLDADYQLRVTVNNLNAYPVQLLEIAVRTNAAGLPVVADASAVVPPNGAVDVVADISDLPGERGTLELYLYNTRVAPRSLRLVAPLDWEPWNQRYRVRATAQRIEATRVVASEARQRQERAAIRRGRVREWVGGAAQGVSERAGELGRDLAARSQRAVRERRARREAARAAERRDGPFSVPLAPSGSRDRASSLEDGYGRPRPPAWGDETRERGYGGAEGPDGASARGAPGTGDPSPGATREAGADAGATRDAGPAAEAPERDEETRAPDDLELKDRKPEPRRRLDFPDEF